MKIVAVIGSPHGMKGSTGQLLQSLLESVEKAGAQVTTFSLADVEVRPCRACGVCHKTGECVIKDGFKAIRDAMLSADGLVLASPNYIFSVSAQMKALMDRCSGPLHCQACEGKYGAAVVTSGGSGSEEVERYLLRFLRSMGCWTVGSVGAEAWQLANEIARAPKLDVASALGGRLTKAMANKETFAEQIPERKAFFERMKSLIEMHKDEWRHEYEYWKSCGRLM